MWARPSTSGSRLFAGTPADGTGAYVLTTAAAAAGTPKASGHVEPSPIIPPRERAALAGRDLRAGPPLTFALTS